MSLNKQILIITGPTGVGKTDFILRLAEKHPIEVINADIGQMYEPFGIGTAKPDWKSDPIPHHMFDILTTPKDFTVADYRVQVKKLIDEIWARGNLPAIVGGSTLYIKSLLFPPIAKTSKKNNLVLNSDENLWEQLNTIDPVRAEKIHQSDEYRIKRALEIWHDTGIKPSEFVPQFDPIAPFKLFILNRPKENLYPRTDKRVIEMMDEGWIDEVESLSSEWHDFLRRKKIIGYEVILDYLDKIIDYNECVAIIQQRVRNYAKRQQTFWRGVQKQIQNLGMHKKVFEVDLTSMKLDSHLRQILCELGFELNKGVHGKVGKSK